MSDDIARLGFSVDTSGLMKGERALDSYGKKGAATESKINKSVDRMNKNFTILEDTIGFVGAALALIGLADLTSDVIGYSDAWTLVNSQLKQVTNSEAELISVRSELLEVTRDTRSELQGTVNLFAEMSRSTTDMGLSSSRLIGITKTVNNLFLAGGKAASETAGAIRQLNQGFASGVLRGDEFNSVAEGAPRIMDALSKSLKLTRGELREFAATGGITSQIMVTALESYSVEAQRLADTTEATFGQMAVLARTNAIEFVGTQKTIQEAVIATGESLVFMSENLENLVEAGKAFIAVIGVGMAAALAKSTSATVASTIASIAATKESLKLSVAAQAQSLAELNLAKSVQSSLVSSLALAQSERTRTAIRMQLAQSTVSLTLANSAYAKSTASVAIATTSAATATTAMGAAVRFLLGPWGLLITAIGTAAAIFVSSKEDSESLREELSDQAGTVKKLEEAYSRMSKQAIGSAFIEAQRVMISLDQKRIDLTSKIENLQGKSDPVSFAIIQSLKTELAGLDELAKDPEARLKSIQNIFEQGINSIKWVDPFEEAADKAKKATKAYNKWIATVTGFQTPLQKVTAEIMKVNAAIVSGDLKPEGGVIAFLTELSERLAQLNTKAEDNTYQDWIDGITSESTIGKLKSLQDEIIKVQEAMNSDDLNFNIGSEKILSLKDEIASLKKDIDKADIFGGMTDSITDALVAMQGLAKNGSKEYKALGVAIAATNAIQAVGAVLNQANGDPYTAFGRMAAMAASVAALGMQIGGLANGIADKSQAAQSSQGLSIFGGKSASIVNSIEVTADATDKLVGINTDMLKALKSVQNGIEKASLLVARDVATPQVDTGGLGIINPDKFIIDPLAELGLGFLGDWIGKGIGKFFGGSSKIVNDGIRIMGGALGDIMDNITVQSFQTVDYKKWKFGSTKTKTITDDITNQVGNQFQLVFRSIADAVFVGATTLGLGPGEVTDAINDFNIATTSISLKGLSAENKQKEIEAVFSRIFDGLAASVVDFLPEFQKVGEGLGETLARVATQVSIAEVAVDAFGFTLGDKISNPEMFARAADNLATLTGGVEEFAEKTSSFIDTFAPDSVKLELHSKSLTKSLGDVGLVLPSTTEGFFKLMQSLNGTTEEGRKQIATLLNVQDTAADYFDLVDDYTDRLSGLSTSLESAIDSLFGATQASTNMSIDAALASAKMGDFTKAFDLDLSRVSANQSQFETMADFNIQQAMTANKLSELNMLTMGNVSISDMTLAANQDQVTLLTSIDTNIANAWMPQQTQIQNNDNVVVELKALRAELELIKNATEATAKSTASSEDDLDAIRRNGLDVRLEA